MGLRRIVFILATTLVLGLAVASSADAAPRCVGAAGSRCGVAGQADHFHGLIAVRGSPWVLNDAAKAGTRSGCGDCRWSIVLACPDESLSDPSTLRTCVTASHAAVCRRGQLLYRVYLTTDAFLDRIEGTVCIGGQDQVVAVGDQATADVARYLKNVTPPDLELTTRPDAATLAGLPTYFSARPPTGLAAATFGGSGITETITISPTDVDWAWGDGDATGWLPRSRTETHSYVRGGVARIGLATRWAATYTITYDGRSFGPYDATGRLTRRQGMDLPVRTSSPVLVSR